MFRVNNGTGIRNMSLSGLTGTLGPLINTEQEDPTGGASVTLNLKQDQMRRLGLQLTCYVQNVSSHLEQDV